MASPHFQTESARFCLILRRMGGSHPRFRTGWGGILSDFEEVYAEGGVASCGSLPIFGQDGADFV